MAAVASLKTGEQFVEFCLEQQVLKFGEFCLKSGRTSPYFFNAGLFRTGEALARLGEYYADAIVASELEFDCIFGPAYKGITLAAAVSIALYQKHGLSYPFAYNRKEAKDHGEGGVIVGELKPRVLVIDDVITAGTAIRESIDLLKAQGCSVVGVIVAMDRQERGPEKDSTSAIQQVEAQFGFKVLSIARMASIVRFLEESYVGEDREQCLDKIRRYQAEFGVMASNDA